MGHIAGADVALVVATVVSQLVAVSRLATANRRAAVNRPADVIAMVANRRVAVNRLADVAPVAAVNRIADVNLPVVVVADMVTTAEEAAVAGAIGASDYLAQEASVR